MYICMNWESIMVEVDLGCVNITHQRPYSWLGPKLRIKDTPKRGYDGRYYYVYVVVGSSGEYYVGKRTSGTYRDTLYVGSSPRSLVKDAKYKYIIRFCDTSEELVEAEASVLHNHKGRLMTNVAGTGHSYNFRTGADRLIWHYYDEIKECIARTNATQSSLLALLKGCSKHSLSHIIHDRVCVPAMRDWCRDHPIDRDESIIEALATQEFGRKKCKPHTRVRPKGIIRGGRLDSDGVPVWISSMDKIDQRAYFNHEALQYLRDKGYRISKIREMTKVPHSTLSSIFSAISDTTKSKHNEGKRKQVDEWIENNPGLFWAYEL
ncbi:hypothetical protein VP150E351_P0234 [Vibrio phage 150E35-1]|nr:hypothetical protein VP150E351_P0234 [Vibrio phage 150E35-1]